MNQPAKRHMHRTLLGAALIFSSLSASAGFYLDVQEDHTADLVYRSYV